MYWRRIAVSVVIVFGATLWMSPFSALAFDFCVADPSSSSQLCPEGSTFSATCIKSGGSPLCLSNVVGGVYEHCCQSSVDPCTTANGGRCVISCGTGGFHVNTCDNGRAT